MCVRRMAIVAIVAHAEDDGGAIVNIACDRMGICVRAFASPWPRGGGRRGASETANTRGIVIVIGRWARE